MTELQQMGEKAYEELRAMNHRLINTASLWPQTVYGILGELQAAGDAEVEVIDHLARTLQASLQVDDVREDDGSDPASNNDQAAAALRAAAQSARTMAAALSEAQNLLAGQSGRARPGAGEKS